MNQTLIQRVLGVINESTTFRQTDFEITHQISSDGDALTITYRSDRVWTIKATFAPGDIQGTIAPGLRAATDVFHLHTPDDLPKLVREWLDRIQVALLTRPLAKPGPEQATEIELLFDRWQTLPDEYFTQSEATELQTKLDTLEHEMAHRLTTLGMEEAKLQARMSELEADVAFLKRTAKTLKKPSWARAFLTRCLSWVRDANNRALLKDGVEIARRLLGPGWFL